MMDRESIFSAENVSVQYTSRAGIFNHSEYWAVKDVSFNIFRGETLGIIGGCGKSTLLKLISGIYQPDKGIIRREKLRASLLTLAAGFDEQLSGYDNAIISSMLLVNTLDNSKKNIQSIEEFAEIGDFFYKPVKTYSSGMRARLGFAVAATMNADVLLVDEVIGVGDERFRIKAENFMIEKMQSDQTVVFVSHALEQVERLCSRVLWIENGTVRLGGDSHEVVDAYRKSIAI